ncbi:L-idonate 5-dehydrogenase [Promicromonospora umidemergens]|uniref:L-idonate 5-dehydrogenase n=1 Tax=Promicromonospora umidemergens TaxID=629679 RepID=A0ABP8WGH5_9MICO|nr:L-idonate 5-dehydrogenase [Promicromonospora umidemergens]MCP2283991.1 L-idonate 5-dehydrogenase [Promicromonospora umidemergens]
MRAVVVHGAGDLRVEERPDPVAQAGEVVVAMEWGGVCGSDLAYWKNGSSGTAVLRDPLVLGHEVAGRVVTTGPGVTGWESGTPVTVHPAQAADGSVLPPRLAGRTNLHSRVRYFGSAAFHPHTDGGFSELRAVPAHQLRRLPDGVSTEQGALAEPLAVAMHAVHRAGDVRGRDVLVNGAGPIGCLVVAAAKHAGAATVTAADLSASSLAVAKELGADHVLDLGAGDRLPDDCELVFEASGAPAALGGVLRATARGGTLVQVGNLPGAPAPAALGDLVTREITWVGAYRFVEEISDALDALGDGLDVSGVVTHRFGIEQAGEALATAAGPGSSKVLIRLSGD